MLLRRFMEHVTEQNWVAVGLDLLVVVVGIFVGLQVSEWNSLRQGRVNERLYLERLVVEFEANRDGLQEFLEMHSNYRRRIAELAYYLQEGKADPERHAELTSKRLGTTVFPALPLRTSTYYELIYAGRLNILRNPQIKESMHKAITEYNYLSSQIEYFRLSGTMDDNVDKLARGLVTPDFIFKTEYDFDPFLRDQDMIDSLTSFGFRHYLLARYAEGALAETDDVLSALYCELDRKECETKDSSPTEPITQM